MRLELSGRMILGAALLASIHLAVPFVPQGKDTCAAASLAMVLRYWGLDISHDEVAAAVAEEGQRDVAGSRLEAFARARGFFALAYAGDREQLRESLAKGRPLIVALSARGGRHHDVVVTGFDDEAGEVLLHDPAEGGGRRVGEAAFMKRWRASGCWSLLVLPRP
jgi:ABC-type bacteriocin/lantibiotic exporter with double-glycine peptidase domain